ncbi:bone morphogenetic protein 7, partial [Caerostris extrusa]
NPDTDPISFNVSSDKTDKLLEGEFHVFKMKPRIKDRRKAKTLKSQLLELKVYQVLPPTKSKKKRRKKASRDEKSERPFDRMGNFSVKEAVADWIKNNEVNLGLTISVRSLDGEPVPKGLVRFARGSHSDHQPLLVLFVDDSRNTTGSISSVNAGHPISLKSNDSQSPTDVSRTKRGDVMSMISHHTKNESCSRHDLYIDFEQIGWAAWIISPKGYNAYQCKGNCHFPLGQNQRPTNHATVQSIAHELGFDTGS